LQELPVTTLVAIVRNLHHLKQYPGNAYLYQVEAALVKKGLHQAPWQQVASLMRVFVAFRHTPGKPFLCAVEQALVLGHPDGAVAVWPEDEREREAVRKHGWRFLGLSGILDLWHGCLVYPHEWDRQLVERMEWHLQALATEHKAGEGGRGAGPQKMLCME
jgi:hypothetical protein